MTKPTRCSRAFPPLLALALVLGAGHARADDATDAETRTIARELAMQGAEALENKDYRTALDRFERAATLVRAPSLTVMQARTLVALGRFVEALDKYEETQRMPLPPDAAEAFTAAVRDAAREAAELRPRLPWLRITLSKTEPLPASVELFLDGKAVRRVTLDVERPIDPGNHELEARSDGQRLSHRSISLAEGDHRTVELSLRTEPVRATEAPQSAAPTGRGWSRRTWGFAAAGVGVAGLTTSLVTGLIALQKRGKLDDVCHPGCPRGSTDDLDSYRMNRTLSFVGLGVGVVGAGVGGYLLLSGAPETSHVALGTSGTGAFIRGKF